MLRHFLFLLIFFATSIALKASHITGGEMFYTFAGFSNGTYKYNVTLKLYQRCESGREFPNPTIVSLFDKTTGRRLDDISVLISSEQNINISNPDPCISNPPTVCYDIAYYNFTISVPSTLDGYVLASQINYRINGINNLTPGSNNVGATYTAEIPGNRPLTTAPENNSAKFVGSDLVVVCANNQFTYSFKAFDQDGDDLRYSFCGAYASTGTGGGTSPTNPPPFPKVPYASTYSEFTPLGQGVQVNPTTGLLTGIAPPNGIYVVTVCVEELRNGNVIARQRKDIQINIADCNVANATLLPEYFLCRNTQTINIANQSTSPLINTTDWDFTDNTNTVIYSTTGPSATYTFPAIGIYKVKLVINRGQPCSDSTTSLIRVFPGFFPDFDVLGRCISKPTFFIDKTTSVYGRANSWKWDFGELTTVTDNSNLQNPTYTYPTIGIKNIMLIATDTRGCRDTVIKAIEVAEKPPLNLSFKDTLICINDRLTLQANGSGIYSWTPLQNIINPTTATPTVSPLTTTTYYVDIDDNGCQNKDSVKVNVVNFVTLQAMADTIVCRGDLTQLSVNSDGLQYAWSPASETIDPFVKNPIVKTNNSLTNFQVTAVIGGCSATDNIIVSSVPYPVVSAGLDFAICYNAAAQLKGTTDGSSWQWSPANMLDNPVSLTPISYPTISTNFVLTAFDTKGCPKPSTDTVLVTVLPKLTVSAGNDTAVVVNQPLQLQALGGVNHEWFPSTFLSAADIANPVAIFPNPSSGLLYKMIAFSPEGCKDSAFITIKVFKSSPIVFVPTAFTPNNDGRNDLLRPISAGIVNIEYFSIYNRWGQLVFYTKTNGNGWDGKVNGVLQNSGTFVWMVKAIDYTGKTYFQKGTTTLIK